MGVADAADLGGVAGGRHLVHHVRWYQSVRAGAPASLSEPWACFWPARFLFDSQSLEGGTAKLGLTEGFTDQILVSNRGKLCR